MRLMIAMASAAFLCVGPADAQTSAPAPASTTAPATAAAPAPNPADVASVDAIIAALYDVISGDADSPRDWDRFRSLYLPGAVMGGVFTPSNGPPRARGMSPERYIQGNAPYFAETGFFEAEIGRRETRVGPLIHVLSSYESRHQADDAQPFARGVNAIQLLDDGQRLWIASVVWFQETPDAPIPPDLLERR